MLKFSYVSNQDNQMVMKNNKMNKNHNNNNNNNIKNKNKKKVKNKLNKISLNSLSIFKKVMDKFYVMNVPHNKEKYYSYINLDLNFLSLYD